MSTALPARKVTLDWSRLLGFDQVSTDGGPVDASAASLTDPRLAVLGGKVGEKGCRIRVAKG
jgi:hypothetical protein